ncbi:MAG: phospholipase D-like domain-containing protein DpdK [Planctomycetaceae bacterium]|jgi:hypothetical protein
MNRVRRIFRSSSTSNAEIRELLEALFAAELLSPSRCLWLVSPWVTDLDLLDNRSGAWSAMDPQWGPRQLRLAELLGRLLEMGVHVVIATRPDAHNEQFLRKLGDRVRSSGTESLLRVHRKSTLHHKGFLGDDFYLSGSMNLTYNGVEILDEGITFETDRDATESARIAFLNDYGGV